MTRPKPDANVVRWIDETDESILFLSVLTVGEIQSGIEKLTAGRERGRLESWLRADLRARFRDRILPFDDAVAGQAVAGDRWTARWDGSMS